MRRTFTAVIVALFFLTMFSGCLLSSNVKFGKIETGKNFMGSRDGYYKKLPHNYCLNITLRAQTQLFKVSDEYVDKAWDSSVFYDYVVFEGHFIKGFFDANYLVLCEEQDNGDLLYLTFDFLSEQVQSYPEISEVYKLLNVDSLQWFALCNTNQEIQRIK